MPFSRPQMRDDLQMDLDQWMQEEAEQLVETVAAACSLMAHADGVVRQAEHDSMAGAVAHFEELRGPWRHALQAEFARAMARFEIDHASGERAALETVMRLRGNEKSSRALLRLCRAIAEADGHYGVEEQAALVAICRRLGHDPVAAGVFPSHAALGEAPPAGAPGLIP